MPNTPPDDYMAKWRELVGGFILAFGDVELITYRLWREHAGDEPASNRFSERTSKLLGYLRRDEVRNREVIAALIDALRIADKRNTVAHNPMQAQVFQHSATGQILVEQAITSETTDDYIDDAELTELRSAAEDLVARLYMAIGFLSKDPRVV
jgi:hypothetical protein